MAMDKVQILGVSQKRYRILTEMVGVMLTKGHVVQMPMTALAYPLTLIVMASVIQ